MSHNKPDIIVEAKNLYSIYGFFGALVACPIVGLSGGLAFIGSSINKTHHQSKIYTTNPETIPIYKKTLITKLLKYEHQLKALF
mgnify:CR=1 FL=1